MLTIITFIAKKTAMPSRTRTARACPSSPRARVIWCARMQPMQQYRPAVPSTVAASARRPSGNPHCAHGSCGVTGSG